MPLRAVIFDFDGLILDTETSEVVTWQAIFQEHGCKFPDSWWMNAIGRGADQVVTLPEVLLEEQLGRPLDKPAFKKAHRDRHLANIETLRIQPGVVELAEECRASGIRTAIASSSHHEWVEGYLEKHDIRDRFDPIVCAEDAPRGKPFPDLYLEALRQLGIGPTEAVALEDSPNGLRAAQAAGIFAVVVPNWATAQCDLTHADARLDSLKGVGLEDFRSLLR